MAKNEAKTLNGEYCRFDVTGMRVTDSLLEAVRILDWECRRNGHGGPRKANWDIRRFGQKLVAIPVDGPFDTLYFNRAKKAWDA